MEWLRSSPAFQLVRFGLCGSEVALPPQILPELEVSYEWRLPSSSHFPFSLNFKEKWNQALSLGIFFSPSALLPSWELGCQKGASLGEASRSSRVSFVLPAREVSVQKAPTKVCVLAERALTWGTRLTLKQPPRGILWWTTWRSEALP